jgi:hypothetical protein
VKKEGHFCPSFHIYKEAIYMTGANYNHTTHRPMLQSGSTLLTVDVNDLPDAQFLKRSGNLIVGVTAGEILNVTSSTDRAILTWDGTDGNAVRNNEAVTIDSNGKLIATASLEVTGASGFKGNITYGDQAATSKLISSTPAGGIAHTFDDAQSSGTGDILSFARNGTNKLKIKSDGSILYGNSAAGQFDIQGAQKVAIKTWNGNGNHLIVSEQNPSSALVLRNNQANNNGLSAPGILFDLDGHFNASSAVQNIFILEAIVNQTGTAGYAGYVVDVVETGLGSGTKRIIDLKTNNISKFHVNNVGGIVQSPTASNYHNMFVVRKDTTDDTVTRLTIDGAAATANNQITISDNETALVVARVIARRTDADDEGAAYELKAAFDRNSGSGSLAIIGSVTQTIIAEDKAAWDATLVADTSTGVIGIDVTGEAAKTIRWTASVQTIYSAE